MTEFGDKEIRSLFEEVRRDDEKVAPSFETVVNRSRHGAAGRWLGLPYWAFALGAMVLLFGLSLALGVWSVRSNPPTATVALVSELSQWRSPTEALLRPPTDTLLDGNLELGLDLDLHPLALPGSPDGEGGAKEKP